MKQVKNLIIFSLMTIGFGLTSCSDDSYNGIRNEGEVKIRSFKAGAKVERLSEEKGTIELIFASDTDLTAIMPEIELSEGASITIPENPTGPVDLSSPCLYRVVNGNLYHEYQVVATHVAQQAKILSFTIGKYKASIDHGQRTISLAYPKGEPVTALSPKITMNEGAELIFPQEQTLDFSQPVDYRIGYLDEFFTYTVQVIPTDLTPVGFLGASASAAEIANPDEKEAWTWLSENFVEPEYISFDEIKKGKSLGKFGVLWFHCDPDKFEIPTVASDPAVIAALKDFRSNGGGLLLTSAGVRLGVSLEIARNGAMWNNDWGFGNAPSLLNENWGIRFTGNESHPAFKGLRTETGETTRCYLLGKGVNVKGHNAIWNFDTWTGYDFDVKRWEADNGGKQLASYYWDDAMNQRSIITEYERKSGNGAVITIAVESYDWYHENDSPQNGYRDNLETLTTNLLNYLAQ